MAPSKLREERPVSSSTNRPLLPELPLQDGSLFGYPQIPPPGVFKGQ